MKKNVVFSMISLCCFVCLFIGLFAGAAGGQETVKIINTAELHKWMTSDEKPLLAFSVSPLEFATAHIPGSICIPYELVKNYYLMPDDLNTPIVFYCHGPG